ncbi:hypothetical protein P7C70_g1063, partial [Phenoliferia sp. Uapishka_3]
MPPPDTGSTFKRMRTSQLSTPIERELVEDNSPGWADIMALPTQEVSQAVHKRLNRSREGHLSPKAPRLFGTELHDEGNHQAIPGVSLCGKDGEVDARKALKGMKVGEQGTGSVAHTCIDWTEEPPVRKAEQREWPGLDMEWLGSDACARGEKNPKWARKEPIRRPYWDTQVEVPGIDADCE